MWDLGMFENRSTRNFKMCVCVFNFQRIYLSIITETWFKARSYTKPFWNYEPCCRMLPTLFVSTSQSTGNEIFLKIGRSSVYVMEILAIRQESHAHTFLEWSHLYSQLLLRWLGESLSHMLNLFKNPFCERIL